VAAKGSAHVAALLTSLAADGAIQGTAEAMIAPMGAHIGTSCYSRKNCTIPADRVKTRSLMGIAEFAGIAVLP
jgi:hypothetical protein